MSSNGERGPIFVFGVARSGTNLLARLLGAHSDVVLALDPLMPLFKAWRNTVAAELKDSLQTPLAPTAPFQDAYFAEDGPRLLDAMLNADAEQSLQLSAGLADDLRRRAALEGPELAQAFADWTGTTVKSLFNDACRIIRTSSGTRKSGRPRTVCIKEVWTAEFIPALARAFPQARFVMIHRDPRAVVASLIALMERDESQAAHSVSYMRHWRKHVALATYLTAQPWVRKRLAVVRYEDLLSDPSSVMEPLARFTGLSQEPEMFRIDAANDWQSNSSFISVGVQAEATGIDSAAAERWRNTLESSVAATVDYHCAPEMRLVGYLPDGQTGALTAEIREVVMAADRDPGKWRSDSGDIAADLEWEQRRWQLLDGCVADSTTVRRCFLFEQVLDATRAATAGSVPTGLKGAR